MSHVLEKDSAMCHDWLGTFSLAQILSYCQRGCILLLASLGSLVLLLELYCALVVWCCGRDSGSQSL